MLTYEKLIDLAGSLLHLWLVVISGTLTGILMVLKWVSRKR